MGLGVGVILLLIIWSFTVFTWLIFSRSQTKLRLIVTSVSSLLTLVLFLLPTEPRVIFGSEEKEIEGIEEFLSVYDYVFIWRAILMLLLVIGIVGGLIVIVSERWTLEIHGTGPVPRKAKTEHWT